MIGKKISVIFSFILSTCLAVLLVSASSSAFCSEENEDIIFYDASQRTAELAMHAMSAIDADYKLGGNSPQSGIDCSGLVRYVYKNAWGADLPRTAVAISKASKSIDAKDLQPGDLVFYNTRRRKFSHVGIYLGDNKFIHAPSKGKKVRVENMNVRYWRVRFNGARRVTDPQKEQLEAAKIIQSFREDPPKTLVRSRH